LLARLKKFATFASPPAGAAELSVNAAVSISRRSLAAATTAYDASVETPTASITAKRDSSS
jgi:hypothetical protein